MSMAQLRQLFVMESSETLQKMEDALLQLEENPQDQEPLNIVFRAIHTIKGSAGIVDLGYISDFAHQAENVLDCARQQKCQINAELIKILLDSEDHLQNMLDASVSDNPDSSTAALQDKTAQLEQQLQQFVSNTQKTPPEPVATPSLIPTPAQTSVIQEPHNNSNNSVLDAKAEPHAICNHWHISLRFHPEAYQHGIDPLAILSYLDSQGKIIHLYTVFSQMPTAAQMNPEHCYLGFEIAFQAANEYIDQAAIESLFELILNDCDVKILAPNDKLEHYIQLLKSLPEDSQILGNALIQIGTLSPEELEQGLIQYNSDKLPSSPKNPPATPQPEFHPKNIEPNKAKKPNATLKIEVEKLDQLLNQVGELVIANSQIQALLHENKAYKTHNALHESVLFISRLVEDIRNSSLSMRMVQIGQSFNRLRRLVHDLSQSLGKQVELIISGADTELDKSMVEKIHDPLVHLIRNAIDHGLETIAERSGSGKPEKGHIYLNAYHESGSIVIEISDDGRGLDRKKIQQAAIKKGLISPEQKLSEQAIDNLIFEPGLSTNNAITDISGRGVGMDVVKRNLQSLNGNVSIYSKTGQGTRVKIHFPLTLVIIDGFLVNSGEAVYVIPLDSVIECAEFKHKQSQPGYIKLRGKALPLLYLDQLFDNPKQKKQRQHVIVVQYGGQNIGLVVDGIQGEFQAVIKPLGPLFENLAGINGATVLGNGEVALILDVAALVDKIGQQQHDTNSQNLNKTQNHQHSANYLIFSIQRNYYALPIDQVKQVLVGQNLAAAPAMPQFIAGLLTLEHTSLPVLDLEAYFGQSHSSSQQDSIIVLSLDQLQIGFQVQHLHQVISLNAEQIDQPIASEQDQHDYFIAGISHFKAETVLIFDVNKLLNRPDLVFLKTA